MGESELVISLDENSGNFDVPDNTKIQRNLQHMQKFIFSRHTIISNQFNMSTNRDFISDRPDCLVGSSARSEGRSVVGHVFQKLDVDETYQSINEEELFGEGDKMKNGPVGRKDYGDENRNDISDGQSKGEDSSLFKKMSSQQRDPKYPELNLSQTSVSSEQDTTSQRRSRFRDSKDLEVIKDSVYADEISGTSREAPGLEPSSGMPDIIKSSSGSSQSSSAASMTLLQQQSPDVLNAVEADVFSKFSDEPDGISQWHEKCKEKLEKKMYIEGISHYPESMSKPSAVHYSSSMFGQHTEDPADEKRGRFRSSGYGTDSKQSQNSQNSMESSAFDGSFEKNDPGSNVINRRGSKGLGRPQIDSAFSEESGQQYESAVHNKYVSVPYLSIFNLSEVSHDSPPNDSESICGNLPNIAALLEMENCDDESVAVTNCVIPHAIDESVAVTNCVVPHAIDESVAVTNSVIQRVNEGDPKDKDLLAVQQNYCLSSSPEETSSSSFKPTLDANEVLTKRMEKSENSKTPSVESSFELSPSYKLENIQHNMALMRHDLFVNQDEINSAKYEQYLQDFPTPSPVGDHQGSPYEKSPRSTPVPLEELTPQIVREDLEYSSRCRDKHCMDERCRRVMAYKDHDAMTTEYLWDLCKALQDHCGVCSEPKCSVMFCSSFAKWCHQSFEFEVLINNLHCLIKEPLLFLNLRKEATILQIDGKLPVLQEWLVVPLATVSGEFVSPVLARVMSTEYPQLLVIKEISQVLDCDQNITVYKQLRNLTHPHIVSHYWLKEYNDNSMHIFMEFVQGGSLSEYLDTVGRLSWETAVHYSRQLVQAVSFLHQHNIVYLYWDAGNILFMDCSYCHVKLCNLSMSCPVDQNKFDGNETKLSLPPHLCPPELGITSQIDRKSDTWGAGCLMIEMLTGKPVWHDKRHENKTKLLELVCCVAPAVPSHFEEEQQEFFRGCLQINIEGRWSFEQVKVFLEQLRLGKHL